MALNGGWPATPRVASRMLSVGTRPGIRPPAPPRSLETFSGRTKFRLARRQGCVRVVVGRDRLLV